MSEPPREPENPEPPRPPFRFKPREFVADNPPASTPSLHGPTDVREHLRLAAAPTPASPLPPAENEVHEILRDNIAHADAAGLNDLKPAAKRRSRRRRDYWITLIGANLTIAALVLIPGPNVVSVIYGFSGMVLFSTGFTWIMWFVMDDY